MTIHCWVAFSLAVAMQSCSQNINNSKQQQQMDSLVSDSVAVHFVQLWTELSPDSYKNIDTLKKHLKKFRLFALDSTQMQKLLLLSPKEKNRKVAALQNIIELPRPDNGFMKFSIYSTSVMDSALEAKFPSLKTYGGQGIDDKSAMIRLDFNQHGFHAYINSQDGEWSIQPADKGITHQFLTCFFKQDVLMPNRTFFELPDSLR